MVSRTSLLLALFALVIAILITSTDARSHHLRHQLLEGRERGRHRSGFRETGSHRRRSHSVSNNNTRGSTSRDDDDDDDGDDDDRRGYYYDAGRVDGITVPSLLAMQTFGRGGRDRARGDSRGESRGEGDGGDDPRTERRPIRGSRKAVVVTKKTYLKKEWCKTQPLKQVVRMRGCLRTKILNNFCYGQCNSFFIPKKARKDKKAEAFMSCGFCRPRRFRWILVTLRCPTGKNGMRYKRKRVQYIKKCRCMAQDVAMPPFS
nr:hypothetical protein BaRGS_031167 [Batillaria attramentaria]